MFDLLIQGAQIVDGTGWPAYPGDVAIKDGRIAAIGQIAGRARQLVSGQALTLIPGLIDPHSHADLILPLPASQQSQLLHCKLAQGITTTIVGNCGLGVAPLAQPETEIILRGVNAWMTPQAIDWGWRSLGDYLRRLEDNGLALNIASLVPHGPVRISAMGLSKGTPTRTELRRMRRLVEQAMNEGALGLSTGLIYPPGMYSPPAELIELAKVVAAQGGIYTSHIRGSSETLLPAVRELIDTGRQTGVRVHHSHNEAVGAAHWSKIAKVLRLEEEANQADVPITFDMFPYTAAATMMVAIYPPWALEGGIPRLLERLRQPRLRARIRRDIERVKPTWPPWREGGWPHNLVRAVGWENILIGYVASPANKQYENLSLAELGEVIGQEPFEAISDLIAAEAGHVSMLIFGISGEREATDYLTKLACHRLGAFCSDAEDYGRGRPHPAAYGAFPRSFELFVRRGHLSFEAAVRKMTSFPAQIFGLRDRGLIRPGAAADLVLVNPAELRAPASFKRPRQLARGVHTVIINGQIVLEDGHLKPTLAGQVLRLN